MDCLKFPLTVSPASGLGFVIISNGGYLDFVGMNAARSAYNALSFRTGNTSNLYLDTAGQVGIGTSAPAAKLDVAGTVSSTNLIVGSQNGTAVGHATCWKTGGLIGYCSTVVGGDGTCTCN
jgi:hypothetical protein